MSALFSPVVSPVVNSTTESLEYNTFQVSGSHLYFLSSVFNFQVTSGFSFLRNDIVYSFLFFFSDSFLNVWDCNRQYFFIFYLPRFMDFVMCVRERERGREREREGESLKYVKNILGKQHLLKDPHFCSQSPTGNCSWINSCVEYCLGKSLTGAD